MTKVLISPGKYVQGAGEMKKLRVCAEGYGTKVLILISEGGYCRIGKDIENGSAGAGCMFIFDYFHGECSKYEIERLRGVMKKNTCNLVMGIGGGKVLDTAKAIVHHEKTAVLICPTIAPTDAPCSVLSVVYTDEGVFEEYLFLLANPNLVPMDTDIIAKSPVRFTVVRMGDVLATHFEAWAYEQSDAVSYADGKATGATMALAKLCFETLTEESVKVKFVLETGMCTPVAEKIIEANMLLSGIGFESAGLTGAHAVHNGLTVLKECHHMYHGGKVAPGTIARPALENVEAAELQKIIKFCIELGLPVTLEELGVAEITKKKIMVVVKAARAENDILHNIPFKVTPDKVYAAIIVADAYGHYLLNES